jgi:hypothetical protein
MKTRRKFSDGGSRSRVQNERVNSAFAKAELNAMLHRARQSRRAPIPQNVLLERRKNELLNIGIGHLGLSVGGATGKVAQFPILKEPTVETRFPAKPSLEILPYFGTVTSKRLAAQNSSKITSQARAETD